MKKKNGEVTRAKRQKTPRIFIGAFTLVSFGIGIYFAINQNYFGSALFILMPVILIGTLVGGSKGKRDKNAQSRKKKEDEGGITDAINDWLGID